MFHSIATFARRGHTLFSFGAIHAAQMLTPLLAIPWLGRALGPECFGLLMYMCLIPPIVALFMDWGLTAGAARILVKCRERPARISLLASYLFSAKLLLALCILAASLLALCIIPHAASWPGAYFLAVALGLCRGLAPLWYYQGMGRNAGQMALPDVCASFIGLALVFIFIRKPGHWPLYLLILLCARLAPNAWLNWRIWRKYRPTINLRAGLAMLGKTRTLFGGALSAMICASGSQLVLGFFLPAAQMGLIVAANKMLRALASLVQPVTQTIFPHVCLLRGANMAEARHLLRRSLAACLAFMCAASLFVIIFAPFIANLVFGAGYPEAPALLRLTILAAPFMACEYALGAQILVPFGQEKPQLKVQAEAALASIILAILLPVCAGAQGSALLPFFVETSICGAFLLVIYRNCRKALFP